jgi:murein DD-endopeptidase MepM/ murein hydrolase activator NlpD
VTARLRRIGPAGWLAATLLVAVSGCSAAPAVQTTYLLPWAAGAENAHVVMQGNYTADALGHCLTGCVTHDDDSMRFAWDFDLPEGTEVLAARAGTVALVNGSWGADHCGGVHAGQAGTVVGQLVGNETNFVQIDQGDGTSALYLHLSSVSPEIESKAKAGESVVQGEVLGLSGKTGYTQCVPHLHFQVEQSVGADWFTDSLPISFADTDVIAKDPGGVPLEGDSYVSVNEPVYPNP